MYVHTCVHAYVHAFMHVFVHVSCVCTYICVILIILMQYVDGFHTAAVLDALGAFVTPSMSVIPRC